MFEILCAVIAVTIIGLTWHIWRPIAKWAAIIGGALALIGGVAVAVIHIRDEIRIAASQKAKLAADAEWRQNGKWKNDPFSVPLDPFTKAVADRNGFALKTFTIKVADGRLLSVTDVDEASARAYGEAWARKHLFDDLIPPQNR